MTQKDLAEYRAQVAAEVAARYGMPVTADQVVIVPQATSGEEVLYLSGTRLVYGTPADRKARAQRMQARAVKFYHLKEREARHG